MINIYDNIDIICHIFQNPSFCVCNVRSARPVFGVDQESGARCLQRPWGALGNGAGRTGRDGQRLEAWEDDVFLLVVGGGHIGKNLVRWFFVFFDGDYGFYDDVIYLLAIFTKFLGDTC